MRPQSTQGLEVGGFDFIGRFRRAYAQWIRDLVAQQASAAGTDAVEIGHELARVRATRGESCVPAV